jgi:hypothetical protein
MGKVLLNATKLKWETEEGIRRWKDLSCSWISRINIVKMAKWSTCSMLSLSKSNDILHRNRKSNHVVHMETQKSSNSQRNYEQKV